jgi:hypothetical protein
MIEFVMPRTLVSVTTDPALSARFASSRGLPGRVFSVRISRLRLKTFESWAVATATR